MKMKNKNTSKTPNLNLIVISFMLKTAMRERKILFLAYFMRFVSVLCSNIQTILMPKFLLDELILQNPNISRLIFYVLLIISIGFFSGIINNLASLIINNSVEWFEEYFNEQIVKKTMSLDFEHTENPDSLDKLNKARDGIGFFSGNVHGILEQFFKIISNFIVILGVITIILFKTPLCLPVQIICIILSLILNKKINKIEILNWKKMAKLNRIFSYLLFEICEPWNGKDIRLYNSSSLFHKKSVDILDEQKSIWKQQNKDIAKCLIPIQIISLVNQIFSYSYIGIKALKKHISIGDFSMCVSSTNTMYQSFWNITSCLQEIQKRCVYANEYLEFMKLPSIKQTGIQKITENYENKDHEIEFKNVSFKYPNSSEYVLKNLNIKIPSNQHLAIVGLNGEGKTTFIKLLCRLYDITNGEILIDGINIKDYDEEEYKKLFAVVFQDFKLFAFTLKENITCGKKRPNLNDEQNDELINQILKQVGLFDDVQKYAEKLNIFVDKRFEENGTEFSGGQKQKLAIARALYKNAPIIIMDEPTAALDPIAEEEIYRQFNTTLSGGKTAIYISHRLSSCKFCDKIAVFSEHTIKEYGNHDELMKNKNGVYYKMFTTQAKQYQKR